jgi:hypothetical protein
MKFKALCFFATLLFLIDAIAQNLVPNPSFEEYSECPTQLDGTYFVEQWYKSIQIPGNEYYQNPSPDYFHECAEGLLCGIPDNFVGTQAAYVGQGYAGLATYTTAFPDHREVIGVELSEPLVPGVAYNLSMRVSLAIGTTTGWASNKLGMKLSMSQIFSSSEDAVNNFSHLYSEVIITDTINWVLIQGIIVADYPYQFLHIGNFYIGSETETVLLGGPFDNVAYYYIDDVSVIEDSVLGVNIGLENSSLQLGPNPTHGVLRFRCLYQNAIVEIYDLSGKLLVSYNVKGSDVHNINVQHLNTGMYIFRVSSENGDHQTEKFIKY